MSEIGRIGLGPGSVADTEVEIVIVDHDPTSVATDCSTGSLIIRSDTGEHFRKLDDGSTTNVSLITDHAPDHILSGTDEVDGDQVGIDFTPTNYTPDVSPSEVTNVDHLTAHLAGIDDSLVVGDSEQFSAHDAAGGLAMVTIGVYEDVPLDTESKKTSGFTHSASSAEVTADVTGTYIIQGYVTSDNVLNTNRSQSEMRLMLNTGGGFAEVGGTHCCMYNRQASEGCNSGAFSIILDLTAGDILKLQMAMTSGITASEVETFPNGSGLTIFEMGNKGVQGETGPAGLNALKKYAFDADMLDSVNNADWNVSSVAPAKKDPNNGALRVRAFDDSTDEGAGFNAYIPANTTKFTLRLKSRGTGASGVVKPQLHYREIPDNGAVGSWTIFTPNDVSLPANSFFQYDEEVITLAELSMTADRLYQFELVRNADDVGDTLSGDWLVVQVQLETDALSDQVTRFYAPSLLVPNSADWAVNARAGEAADSNNAALSVRLFDDTVEEGVGFVLFVPADAVSIKIILKSRAETGPAGAVTAIPTLYTREVPDNAAVAAWDAGTNLTALNFPITTEFWQYDEQIITLATLSMTAGSLYQFELTRDGAGTLVGDWALLELGIEFI